MLLTTEFFRSRLLGKNEEITLRHSLTPFATGNNLSVRSDTARRAYWIRLEPQEAAGFTNRTFRHEGIDRWLLEHRMEFLLKILVMARAWYVAGQPLPKAVPRILGYEAWSQTLGGILEFAGVPEFLKTFQEDAESNAREQSDWTNFIVQWYGT
jgi:putative DNA primase/helicase